ncbi:MAG: prepilin peptidase [bacterium]
MTGVILFVLGLIIGSFLNVLGLRWNSGTTLGRRSGCPVCGKTLRWFELIPIISFLWQRGRCRGCGTRISWQYPTIEILTGLVFVTLYFVAGLTTYYLLLITIFSIFIIILIYDFRHRIIPDNLVYSAIILSLFIPLFLIPYSLLDWLAGPIIFIFFALIWFFSHGRAMGFGDAKLGLALGLLLGAAQGFSAVVLAFWLGAGTMLIVMFFSGVTRLLRSAKKLTMKSEIPFAPFFILGAWLSLIYELDLLHVLLWSK